MLLFCQFSILISLVSLGGVFSGQHFQLTLKQRHRTPLSNYYYISQRRTVDTQIWPVNLLYLPGTLALALLLAGLMGNVSRVFYISDAFDGSWDPSRHARWPGWFNNTVIEHFMMYDSPGKLQLQLYPQRLRNAVDYHRKSFWFIHQFWKNTCTLMQP